MRDERIGNDINIAWGIKSGDSPFSLEGKNVTLYLHHPYGKQRVEGFRLEGNKVIWTFKGADQKYVGKHGLTLVVNEGANGMITTDSCDFVNLVACSCQVGGEDNDGVQTEAIELTSTLGFIAYDDTEIREELARLDEDKADRSELTELSAEVSGLSERVDELGEGGSSVFNAIWGETSYEDVKAAFEARKACACIYNNIIYNAVSMASNGEIQFVATTLTSHFRLSCSPSGVWSTPTSFEVERAGNKVTTISDKSTDTQYPSAKAVYNAIQQSGTPSGDPMHYMFEAVGATYNATDADIPMVGMYGDSYVHKAKHWHLNELGDITNEEMRNIYNDGISKVRQYTLTQSFCASKARTNITIWKNATSLYFGSYAMPDVLLTCALGNSDIEVFSFYDATTGNIIKHTPIKNMQGFANNASKIVKVLGGLTVRYLTNAPDTNAFRNASELQDMLLFGAMHSFSFHNSPKLSFRTIKYFIANATATSKITLTLHATALANAEAAYLADVEQDTTTYPTLSDWALSKNIQIATA